MKTLLPLSIVLALWTSEAAAQSVDCRAPRTLGQELVCGDYELRGFDRRLNGDYLWARTVAEPPEYFALKRGHKRYVAARDACRSKDCLRRVFERRRAELRDVLIQY